MSSLRELHLVNRLTRQKLQDTACFKSGDTVSVSGSGAVIQRPDGHNTAPIPTQDNWRQGSPALVLVPEGRWEMASQLARAPYIGGPEEV